MEIKIDNKIAFSIYVWTMFFLLLGWVIILLCDFLKIPQKIGYVQSDSYLIIIAVGISVVIVPFEYLINPSYFEAIILNGKIIFKSFEPNKKNGFIFFMMLFYRKYIDLQTIERQAYNNYKIKIDRLGFRKRLIFQKVEKGQIYESTPINISFLSTKKYTELILSIDRLQEKISLN